jgi:glycosyltransferase involved in cell wall biosynthesis
MRIVIDMQGAQTESRFRGIGRYTQSFAQAVVRNRGEHEIILALSGLFPDTIEPIRAAFDGLLPQENIRVWHAPGPVKESDPGNDNRREVAELIREAFLTSLQPDVIHNTSLFEGYVDNAVTSIGRFDTRTPVTAVLYDLIPLLNPDQYLTPNPSYAAFYQRKVEYLQLADSLLAISDFARQEGMTNLSMDEDKLVNISTAIEPCYVHTSIDVENEASLRKQLGITRHFVLYTGGADERKNLPRLIQAFAKLPPQVRRTHQLVFAGRKPEGNIAQLKQTARSAGLKDGEVVFTGYVSDEQLVQLYNLCSLYVFPSWHEGFGLPALEAMACGAAVIGANTSSLPEVIGLREALFDPLDVDAIRVKMLQALTDEAFNNKLREHGSEQAKKFSWNETARRALSAWKSLADAPNKNQNIALPTTNQLIKALAPHLNEADDLYLAALSNSLAQNASSGIERHLFVDVSELCQRDSATGVQRVVRSYLFQLLQNPPSGFIVLPVYATQTEGYRYATEFAARLTIQQQPNVKDEPIRWQRGDLFFGLDMQHHVQLAHAGFYARLRLEGVVVKFLVYDLLPIQLADFFKDSQAKELHEQWLKMIAMQDEAICISHATEEAFKGWLTKQDIPTSQYFRTNWVHMGADLEGSKPSLGLPTNAIETLRILNSRPTFLAVSTLEPRKAQTQILDALEQLWADGHDVNLVLVGQAGWKIETLITRLDSHPENGKRLFWLRGISDEYLELVYKASTCLIAASINEGFGLPLIEAARHGIPIVARNIPVFKEVASQSAHYFNGETGEDLAKALVEWLQLNHVGAAPSSAGVKWTTWQQATENLKTALLTKNYPEKQLLVDISELAQRDAKTGIQRVVRNVLREWLENPPEGYRVEPVYATHTEPYKYARKFAAKFMGHPEEQVTDEPIDFAPGDSFFGLDFQPRIQAAQSVFYQHLRRQGVTVKFMVYDLLCIQMPHFFPPHSDENFLTWLNVVMENDGVVCISNAVAKELTAVVNNSQRNNKRRLFKIDANHLGADLRNAHSSTDIHQDSNLELEKIKNGISFLMVGTLEPRKGHLQVLDAFECLWKAGKSINLVIAGKKGWMVDDLVKRLSGHTELNKRLFWLQGISDEYLERVFAEGTCLIAASYGEGFGLPLIEAVQHKLPVIARDIPVFREVAGDHAYYFATEDTKGLSLSIKNWLVLYENGKHPKSNNMLWLTWNESAENLRNVLIS